MIRFLSAAAAIALLTACGTTGVKPTVEEQIVQACVATGLFKPYRPIADVAITVAVPVASLPVGLLRAGVDAACANPARIARDAEAVSQLFLALRAATQR